MWLRLIVSLPQIFGKCIARHLWLRNSGPQSDPRFGAWSRFSRGKSSGQFSTEWLAIDCHFWASGFIPGFGDGVSPEHSFSILR